MTFAVETANPRIQKMVRKSIDLEKVSWTISETYKKGIIPIGFFMLGFPTETREEIEETIRFACDSKLLRTFFFAVVPFPRTELFNLYRSAYPEEFDLGKHELDYMHYYSAQSLYGKVTGENLEEIINGAYRRFHMNPGRVARILARYPWNRHLLKGIYLGFVATTFFGRNVDEWFARRTRKRMGMEE
jgi:radical SAM superfamily enzyme YgiQ (UPF0313 family)